MLHIQVIICLNQDFQDEKDFHTFSMPMLVKFSQNHPENPENPENPDSDKLELKCVTSVNNIPIFYRGSFYFQ